MVKLIIGRAGSGKTSALMEEIRSKGKNGESGMILIVPEQFSHDAERELAKICGDSASLFCEVLSFSRLSSRVLSECGGFGIKPMDNGGRLLLMSVAVNSVRHMLKAYNTAGARTELLSGLIQNWDEFNAAGMKPSDIEKASALVEDFALSDKLRDMSIIFEAYLAHMPQNMCDPYKRLEMMAEGLEKSTIFTNTVYFDGFSDFTYQQQLVIKKLMKLDIDITAAITCDTIYSSEEIFHLTRDTVNKLNRFARESGQKVEITVMDELKNAEPELRHLEKIILRNGAEEYDGECNAIELYKADSVWQECELAAAKTVELVRDHGMRFHDIGVAVRNFGDYSSVLESVFTKYGVPVMNTGKTDILAKPVMALVVSALDIVSGGWEQDAVLRYLKTELVGITRSERDELENYIEKWNIRGGKLWYSDKPWKYHPRGYNLEFTEQDNELLERINALRVKIAEPFKCFERELREDSTAVSMAKAIYNFLKSANLPQILADKVQKLREQGNAQLSGEYLQLWDIIVTALEQFADVLGDMELDLFELRRLFTLLLSQYQVGTIPVSLDSVTLGDMAKMRRRGLKCLIIIGASDDALPSLSGQKGLLSDIERDELGKCGLGLNDNSEMGLFREYNLIYSSLTLPSEKLIMTYPASKQPSFILTEIENVFNIKSQEITDEIKENAPIPCFELALMDKKAPKEYFSASEEWAEKMDSISRAVKNPRGHLSEKVAADLYSKNINISPSRVDKFYSCRFMYFMEYGLKAQPRKQAKFDAPAIGTFMHFILENTAREAEKLGGFGKIGVEKCSKLAKKYVEQYIAETLGGLEDKSARFIYLFRRLSEAIERIVADMAEELSVSDFKPIDFELSFARGGDLDSVRVTDGDITVNVNGKVDRVDGWINNGRLYLRIVDYKTGKKSFNLSDIWYGMGLQMLIYLFALEKYGDKRYGSEIAPAGVLYAPAIDATIKLPLGADLSEIEKQRAKERVRKGLILNDTDVLEAMEHGKSYKYLPIKINAKGEAVGESLCSANQLCDLARHVDSILLEMGKEMRKGSIDADPYFRNSIENVCQYCKFKEACNFNENRGDRKRYLTKLKTGEVWEKLNEKTQEAQKMQEMQEVQE